MSTQGYVRFPTIHQDRIIFVAEDDLWFVSSEGGRAERLTAGVGEVSYPHFSPDGELLAFVGREEGPSEVYVMPSLGGTAQRLTFHSASCRVAGWDLAGEAILYASNAGQALSGQQTLFPMVQRAVSSLAATHMNQHVGNAIEVALRDIYGVTQQAAESFSAFSNLMAT